MARLNYDIKRMSGLWRVRRGKNLFYPRHMIGDRDDATRGGAGYIVDLDKAYEKILCDRQERILEKVPPGAVAEPGEIKNILVLRWLKKNKWIDASAVRETRRTRLARNERESAQVMSNIPDAKLGSDKPAPAPRAPRYAERRTRKTPEDTEDN